MRKSRAISAGASLAGVVAAGLLTFSASQAAFSSTTGSDTNQFAAGTITVTDNDSDVAMFSVVDMVPGVANRVESCIEVTYAGSLTPADVRLFVAPGDLTGGLATYLDLAVDRGASATGFGDCSGFGSTESIYNGTLSGFASAFTSFATGAGTWAPAATPESQYYRFVLTLQAAPVAQGGSSTVGFTWEAQNQ